jgi:putative phosphoesterase
MTAPRRIAALYDIHGNLPALEAVLDEVRRESVDLVVVGGDVFPGPLCRESLERLMTLDAPVQFITGNGDRETCALADGVVSSSVPPRYLAAMQWVADQLDSTTRRFVQAWPPITTVDLEGVGPVLFCHATPASDTDIFTRLTPESRLRPLFENTGANLVVCGHTHMAFDRTIGRVRVVNAGSVGMPFADPGAYWLLLAPEVQLRRETFDMAAAATRIAGSGYPQADEFVRDYLLEPPSEARMLDVFAQAQLGGP